MAARTIWHHHAMLESGARDPPHCLEAVHSRPRAAQVISDCSVWRHAYSNRLLVGEHAHGPPAGSPPAAYFAKALHVVAKSRRFAYAFLGRDDNQFGDRDGCRIVAINQPELAQCGFECCRQISNVFPAKCGRVLIFQDCANWHVQPLISRRTRGG